MDARSRDRRCSPGVSPAPKDPIANPASCVPCLSTIPSAHARLSCTSAPPCNDANTDGFVGKSFVFSSNAASHFSVLALACLVFFSATPSRHDGDSSARATKASGWMASIHLA